MAICLGRFSKCPIIRMSDLFSTESYALINFVSRMGYWMAIRMEFAVVDGREHPKRRSWSIPNRIFGPEVICFSRKRFPENIVCDWIELTNCHARNDRRDRRKISSVQHQLWFVIAFACDTCVVYEKPTLPIPCIIASLHHVNWEVHWKHF